MSFSADLNVEHKTSKRISCRSVCQRKLLQQHSEAVILLRKVCGEDGLYVDTIIPEDIDESFILFGLRSDGLREGGLYTRPQIPGRTTRNQRESAGIPLESTWNPSPC